MRYSLNEEMENALKRGNHKVFCNGAKHVRVNKKEREELNLTFIKFRPDCRSTPEMLFSQCTFCAAINKIFALAVAYPLADAFVYFLRCKKSYGSPIRKTLEQLVEAKHN